MIVIKTGNKLIIKKTNKKIKSNLLNDNGFNNQKGRIRMNEAEEYLLEVLEKLNNTGVKGHK